MDVEADNRSDLEDSILSSLGGEVTSIVSPVSACMGLTVLLVRTLYLGETHLSTAPTSIATAVYHEEASDDVGTKLTGALLNALVFVAAITIMTFIMFLLFKYNCTKCLYGYMAFSSFTLLFWVGGYFIQVILETSKIPFDAISFVFLLFNSATVGTIAMWTSWTPFVLKQAYLVLVAVVIAVLFTRIPAWTTWFLLGALVIYDLCAVLLPGGPLKALVELAMERNEAIPALVYESRPTTTAKTGGSGGGLAAQGEGREIRSVTEADGQGAERRRRRRQRQRQADQEETEMETASTSMASPPDEMTMEESNNNNNNNSNSENGAEEPEGQQVSPNEPLIKAEPTSSSSSQHQVQGSGPPVVVHHEEEEDGEMGLPDSIKLGLGDFIFYSVLVGQASLYDMTTVYVCYLAIMAGLGATLLLLAIYQKALPALPISITLGVVFYFCTRYFLDPTVTPMSLSLLYV